MRATFAAIVLRSQLVLVRYSLVPIAKMRCKRFVTAASISVAGTRATELEDDFASPRR